ncbi:Mss4-like protein [Exidia glandulosa HHB12029]|uniref:Mss4-like protein n=1 Tax=Exidia glandulosa HHB12029 TaxID=1314781 RepID=A0A165LMX8_EXIGL|nr:Mss4-like protein [Exidia glandulosa HHB12029]
MSGYDEPDSSNVWAALQAASKRARPIATPKAEVDQLTKEPDQLPGDLVNKYDLLCPRAGCGSVILKNGVGVWVRMTSGNVQLEPATAGSHPDLPALPTDAESEVECWLVTPNPMAFENIGFSRPVASSTGKKFLACAECDLGPLGWCFEGESQFWLVADRVGYRTA